jgi:hypothetical protein
MSFFVRLDPSEFNPKSLLEGFFIPEPDKQCSLYVGYDFISKKYTYAFDPSQFVLWSPEDTITFNLVNTIPSLATMRLHKHCCTDQNSPKLIKLGGAHDVPETAATAYHATADKVRMKLVLHPDQMVHIGLIVQITPKDSNLKPDFLLCDPQVGSGPP